MSVTFEESSFFNDDIVAWADGEIIATISVLDGADPVFVVNHDDSGATQPQYCDSLEEAKYHIRRFWGV